MGFFAGLNDEKYDRQYKDSELVRRMVAYFGSQKMRLALASVVIIVIAVIGAALPVIVSRMVDLIKDRPSSAQILWVGAALIGVASGGSRSTMGRPAASRRRSCRISSGCWRGPHGAAR